MGERFMRYWILVGLIRHLTIKSFMRYLILFLVFLSLSRLSFFLSFCLFVFLSFCLYVFLSFCLLSVCLFVFLSFCLFVFLSFCFFVFLLQFLGFWARLSIIPCPCNCALTIQNVATIAEKKTSFVKCAAICAKAVGGN